MVAVALELQHAVDEVLEHARAGDRAVLRHVADEERGDAVLLRDAQQATRGLAHLRDRARRGADLLRPERLHRVDHADGGPLALERLADDVELGLGEDLDVVAAAEARRAQLHLRDRLLAGDEERAPLARDRAERGQEQRRLADARLAADEHERRGHEPAAEHTVELGHAGRDALGLLDDDVDEPQQRRPGMRGRLGAAHRHRLGEHRPELTAAGAAPEPAAGRRPALGADVLDGRRFRHGEGRYSVVPTATVPALERSIPMRYRQLGDSDLTVSEISLGSWLTYGGGVGDEQARACVDAAFEAGINFIDTANVYARGAAEELPRRRPARPRARLVRARDEALLPDGRHGREPGALARAGAQADRRLAAAPAHRPRRPLPVPPLRHGDAARGDDGGAHRGRARRQGALHRLQRVDAAADPGRARPEPRARLGEVRLVASRSTRCSGASRSAR